MNLEHQIDYSQDNLTDLCLDDLDDLELESQSNNFLNNNDKSQLSNFEFLQEKQDDLDRAQNELLKEKEKCNLIQKQYADIMEAFKISEERRNNLIQEKEQFIQKN